MNNKRLSVLLITAILSLSLLAGGMLFYIERVNTSLWQRSVTEILELTRQGSDTLDTFIEKDYDTLQVFINEMARKDPDDQAWIQEHLTRFKTPPYEKYYCVDLDENRLYGEDAVTGLEPEKAEYLSKLSGQGVLEPYNDSLDGVQSLGVYKRFTFSNGHSALVLKQHRIEDIAQNFALSFYSGSGFSYVVKNDGEVLIRSANKNSNRTFKNLYDIIDLSGKNSESALASFRTALESGQSGTAVFSYNTAQNVFC